MIRVYKILWASKWRLPTEGVFQIKDSSYLISRILSLLRLFILFFILSTSPGSDLWTLSSSSNSDYSIFLDLRAHITGGLLSFWVAQACGNLERQGAVKMPRIGKNAFMQPKKWAWHLGGCADNESGFESATRFLESIPSRLTSQPKVLNGGRRRLSWDVSWRSQPLRVLLWLDADRASSTLLQPLAFFEQSLRSLPLARSAVEG